MAEPAIALREHPQIIELFTVLEQNGLHQQKDEVCRCYDTLMIVSCLHLGQYRGKFSSTVSGRTLIRVLLLQIGHSTHFSSSNTHLLPFRP